MSAPQWLAYQSERTRTNIILGYYDFAISKCGIISQFLVYHLLKTNRLITVSSMGEIFERLDALGDLNKRVDLLLTKGVLAKSQGEILNEMNRFRANHRGHFFTMPRYIGIRCLVDGIAAIHGLRSLLRDGTFTTILQGDLVPECVWGFWLG